MSPKSLPGVADSRHRLNLTCACMFEEWCPPRGGWADSQCGEQELLLLCGVDPQQCEGFHLWYSPWGMRMATTFIRTAPPSRRCGEEVLISSQPCLEEIPSSTGTQEREWMRWSSLRLNPTWPTLYQISAVSKCHCWGGRRGLWWVHLWFSPFSYTN